MQALQDVHGRSPVLRNGNDADSALFDALLLPPFDLLPVLRPQVEQQPHAGMFPALMLEEPCGDLPAAHVGHEDDPSPAAFRRRDDMLPPLVRRCEIIAIRQAEPVQEDVDEMVILPPGAPEWITAPPVRKEAAVEADADGDAAGEKRKYPVATCQAISRKIQFPNLFASTMRQR